MIFNVATFLEFSVESGASTHILLSQTLTGNDRDMGWSRRLRANLFKVVKPV